MNLKSQRWFITMAVFMLLSPIQLFSQDNDSTKAKNISYRESFYMDNDQIIPSKKLRLIQLEIDSLFYSDSIAKVNVTGMASIDGKKALSEN